MLNGAAARTAVEHEPDFVCELVHSRDIDLSVPVHVCCSEKAGRTTEMNGRREGAISVPDEERQVVARRSAASNLPRAPEAKVRADSGRARRARAAQR